MGGFRACTKDTRRTFNGIDGFCGKPPSWQGWWGIKPPVSKVRGPPRKTSSAPSIGFDQTATDAPETLND